MRPPSSRPQSDCWQERAWWAGTIHQPRGLSSLNQQLHDVDGLRTGIWYLDIELRKAGPSHLAELFWVNPNLEDETSESPRDLSSIPAVRPRQPASQRQAEVTQPASAGAAHAEAIWSPSLSMVKWTGLLNSSVGRSITRTISAQQPLLQPSCTPMNVQGLQRKIQAKRSNNTVAQQTKCLRLHRSSCAFSCHDLFRKKLSSSPSQRPS